MSVERRVGWLMHALGLAAAWLLVRQQNEGPLWETLWEITERVGTAPEPFPRGLAPDVAVALTRLMDACADLPELLARVTEARARAIELALEQGEVWG